MFTFVYSIGITNNNMNKYQFQAIISLVLCFGMMQLEKSFTTNAFVLINGLLFMVNFLIASYKYN